MFWFAILKYYQTYACRAVPPQNSNMTATHAIDDDPFFKLLPSEQVAFAPFIHAYIAWTVDVEATLDFFCDYIDDITLEAVKKIDVQEVCQLLSRGA